MFAVSNLYISYSQVATIGPAMLPAVKAVVNMPNILPLDSAGTISARSARDAGIRRLNPTLRRLIAMTA